MNREAWERKKAVDVIVNGKLKRVFGPKPGTEKPGVIVRTMDGRQYKVMPDGSRRGNW